MVLQDPLVRRRAHREGADRVEEPLISHRTGGVDIAGQQPREGVVRVRDEAVDAGRGEVHGGHGPTVAGGCDRAGSSARHCPARRAHRLADRRSRAPTGPTGGNEAGQQAPRRAASVLARTLEPRRGDAVLEGRVTPRFSRSNGAYPDPRRPPRGARGRPVGPRRTTGTTLDGTDHNSHTEQVDPESGFGKRGVVPLDLPVPPHP